MLGSNTSEMSGELLSALRCVEVSFSGISFGLTGARGAWSQEWGSNAALPFSRVVNWPNNWEEKSPSLREGERLDGRVWWLSGETWISCAGLL